MIKSLALSNLQSHKETMLQFSPGVNAIVGNSDSGKSAILRSLYWLIQNKPAPATLLSHWAKDKEGKQTDRIQVDIELDNSIVSRWKDKNQNAYGIQAGDMDPIMLEAVGKDVPEEVQDLLNMTEVNIQKQLEAPFLLSESAGEVARFFNQLIKLDDIDKALSSADSFKRINSSEMKAYELQETQLNKDLAKYDWLDEAVQLVEKLSNMEERLAITQQKYDDLTNSCTKWKELSVSIGKYECIDALISKFSEVQKIEKELEELSIAFTYMEDFIRQYKGIEYNINRIPDLVPINKKREATESLYNKIVEVKTKFSEMEKDYLMLEQGTNQIEKDEKRIKELSAMLPEVCVLCGAPIKGGTYDHKNDCK